MAGETRTCTNCGNQQATGAFCERCGTRLPEIVLAQTPTATPTAPAPQAGVPPTQYATQAQYDAQSPYGGQPWHGASPQQAQQPQYGLPRTPGPFSKLFDLSFQGFVTRGSLRVIFISTLALLGVYWLFALIFGIVAAAKLDGYWSLGIFSSLALTTLMIIWTRIMMELAMTVTEMRQDVQKAAAAAEARAAEAAAITEATKAKNTTKSTTRSTTAKASKAAPKTTASRAKKKS